MAVSLSHGPPENGQAACLACLIEVIKPEKEYDGIQYKNKPSNYGSAITVQQLRDPCIFEEEGRTYLFYAIAGEMGIAMAELEIEMKEGTR